MDSIDTPEAKDFLSLAFPGEYRAIEVTEQTHTASATPNTLWDGEKFIRVGISPEGIPDDDFRYVWDMSSQKWIIPQDEPIATEN